MKRARELRATRLRLIQELASALQRDCPELALDSDWQALVFHTGQLLVKGTKGGKGSVINFPGADVAKKVSVRRGSPTNQKLLSL